MFYKAWKSQYVYKHVNNPPAAHSDIKYTNIYTPHSIGTVGGIQSNHNNLFFFFLSIERDLLIVE